MVAQSGSRRCDRGLAVAFRLGKERWCWSEGIATIASRVGAIRQVLFPQSVRDHDNFSDCRDEELIVKNKIIKIDKTGRIEKWK
jgi:hypothetical protein